MVAANPRRRAARMAVSVMPGLVPGIHAVRLYKPLKPLRHDPNFPSLRHMPAPRRG